MARYTGNAVRTGRYRSGLEATNAEFLEKKGFEYSYEEFYLPYVIPSSNHKYTPDFILKNGIIVETKGIFDTNDRKKHLLIREQYPELDIRLVFHNANSKISSGSKTSVAEWCEKNDFIFAHKLIPVSWLKEKVKALPDVFKKIGRK